MTNGKNVSLKFTLDKSLSPKLEGVVQVLVHAGSGGVGLAALQVAKTTSCHVVSTAGNPEKRAAVRARGATMVAGSRDTHFVDILGCGKPTGDCMAFCVLPILLQDILGSSHILNLFYMPNH